ncbi:MAG TPA: sulfite exporter TauE/SafE family protein [Planctomycetota bacterium]
MLPDIPAGVSPALYYVCVGLAVLVIGLSKAGFGGGIGILAMPLTAAAMPGNPTRMLGILLPLLILADILSNLHYLKAWETRLLKPMLIGAGAGIVLGSFAVWWFQRSDPAGFKRTLSLLIGGICLAFVAIQLPGLWGRPARSLPPGRGSSLAVGGVAGFVSTMSHGAGPIVTLYLLQEKLEKRLLVGTLVFFFLIVNVAKVPTYVAMGWIHGGTLRDGLWTLPLLPLGTLAGAWLHKRVPEKPFIVILYVATAVTAVHMIATA